MHPQQLGIDFVGFPRGKLGVGEMVRSLMRVALHKGYQINAIDCIHQDDLILNDHDEFDPYISNEFKYNLRIYSLTQNHIAALLYRFGTAFFDNKMNIFHLAWEFDTRPKELDSALQFCDEIWAISEFTAKAFENNFNIPVYTMHCPVDSPSFLKRDRSFFKLPSDLFLYCFSFDMNSFLTRKNPLACINAFKLAYEKNKKIGLVIKVSNADAKSTDWQNLLNLISNNVNIFIINEIFDKKTVYSLFDCCDAYISLHRSEGFGIGMAENMLLEKPIICTGYSGNMDFCTSENSFLVDYSLTDVKKDQYISAEGFHWAEPSILSAVHCMEQVYDKRTLSNTRALLGQSDIEAHFSVAGLSDKFDNFVKRFIARSLSK